MRKSKSWKNMEMQIQYRQCDAKPNDIDTKQLWCPVTAILSLYISSPNMVIATPNKGFQTEVWRLTVLTEAGRGNNWEICRHGFGYVTGKLSWTVRWVSNVSHVFVSMEYRKKKLVSGFLGFWIPWHAFLEYRMHQKNTRLLFILFWNKYSCNRLENFRD